MTDKRRPWTDSDDRFLRELREAGRSARFIAAELRRTPQAVEKRLERLGVRGPAPERDHGDRISRAGLLARIAARLGRVVGPDAEAQRAITDDDIDAWASDPETFFAWLGVGLFPYQKEALAIIRASDRVCIVWPRQHGKDTITALYGLWVAVTSPGSVIVCVSPSQRQSNLWMDELKAFVLGRRELRSEIGDMSETELSLSNGSRVYSLPSGAQGSATIRGFSRVSVVVANEAAWIADETFAAIQPFLAVSGAHAKLVLASTPFGQAGFLWRAFNNPAFARHHVTEISSPLIPADFVDKERGSMDALTFASEWNATFISGQSSYFPTELVVRCTESYDLVETPLPQQAELDFYLGADWARVEGGDRTVLTVVGIDREGHGRVLWIKTFEGTSYVDQANYVAWLDKQWGFSRIFSDASAFATNDMLASRGLPVEPVVFSQPGKVELYSRLKAAMESGRLTIPNHPDLLREVSTFQYKVSDAGNLLLHHAAGGHDDYPDSLALAAHELTRERIVMDPEAAVKTAEALMRLNEAFGRASW